MKKQTYKRTGNCGLFDLEENTAKLCSLGNPLEKLLKVVDFEMFRETLEGGLYKEKLYYQSNTINAINHENHRTIYVLLQKPKILESLSVFIFIHQNLDNSLGRHILTMRP